MQRARSKVLSRYKPEGNVHLPMLDNRYISCSQLVSRTAEEMARLILIEAGVITDEELEDVSSYWSYKGNALGDRALEDVEAKEIHFEVPIGQNGWRLSGNCDGIEADQSGVVVYEHKAYGFPTRKKVEGAKRQAMLYLAMGWWNHHHRKFQFNIDGDGWSVHPVDEVGAEKHSANRVYENKEVFNHLRQEWEAHGEKPVGAPPGSTWFYPAAYVNDGPHHFEWPETALPAGVLVCVAPNYPEGEVHDWSVDHEDCEEVLSFYLAKAKVIIKAVEAGDPLIARDQWDRKDPGAAEFARDIEEFNEPLPDDFDALAKEYHTKAAAAKAANEAQDEAKALLIACMDKHGLDKCESDNYRVSLVEVKDKVVPEHVVPEKVKKGYRYVRVTESS